MTERELRAFADLVGVCRRLRGPDGCPWDREQTLTTMTPYLTEEAVESGEAIASGDRDHVAEELGDLAFLAIFCLELLESRAGPDSRRAWSARRRSSSDAIRTSTAAAPWQTATRRTGSGRRSRRPRRRRRAATISRPRCSAICPRACPR